MDDSWNSFDIGPSLRPWLVSMVFAPAPGPSIRCENAGPPLRLRSPPVFEAVRFDHDATLEVDVEDRVAANGFPVPSRRTHRITQADFPAIVDRTRRAAVAAFGRGYDQP